MALSIQRCRTQLLIFVVGLFMVCSYYSYLHSTDVKFFGYRGATIPVVTYGQVSGYMNKGGEVITNKKLLSSGLQDRVQESKSLRHVGDGSIWHEHLPYDSSMIGMLNWDIWHWVTGYLVDDLRINRDFPQFPDERKTVTQLHFEFDEVDKADVRGRYGHKVYGYLLPPTPGSYSFKVDLTDMVAATDVELWISTDMGPLGMKKVLTLVYDDLNRPVRRRSTLQSKETADTSLMATTHYFEFLAKAYEGRVLMDVLWKTPSSDKYEPIPMSCFALAVKIDGGESPVEGPATHSLSEELPSSKLQTHHRVFSTSNAIYPIKDLPVLPSCEFTALYAMRRRIKGYSGIYQVFESRVEPKDETWFTNWKRKDIGNTVIDKKLVEKVVSLYTVALNASKLINGDLVSLRYLEETPNKEDGSRFLLEMDIQLYDPEEIAHTSEYVYLKKDSDYLCHTNNFQWTKNAEVYFIVAVKNLGYWVKQLIYNMEDIYEKTRDEHFSLVIVDSNSMDMDIEAQANRSSFRRIQVLHLEGSFSRSGGLQAGIDSIKDQNSIVMTIDMHLTLPPGIVEYTRRHTVQHKMAFTPMFFRLNKGYTDVNWNGFWEKLTYGLFAMYKGDWEKFGGFNTRKYKTKWGGEDWDILDRSLAKGFEAFRIRPPGLTHYHHTKKGMWGNPDVKFTKKWILHR